MAVTASISLKENSYSVANNSSSVTCKVTVHWTYSSNDRNGTTKTLTFNGSKFTTTTNINSSVTTSGSMTLFNKTLTVAHNSDGTKTVSASVKIPTNTSSGTVTASKSLTLTAIPRYPTVSQSVNRKTETSITINWSSNAVCDYLWYSTNAGSSWVAAGGVNSSSGTCDIPNLTPNTTYNIKIRLRRKDSQLSADAPSMAVATYAYPYVSSMPNFTLGDNFTTTIYNPLSRTYRITFIAQDDTEYPILNDYTQTSLTWNSAGLTDHLYQSIPNAKSGTYKMRLTAVFNSHSETRTGGTYTVNTANASPSFSSGSYQDTNTTVLAVTGDNQKLLPTRSTIQFDMSGMTAKLYATVSSAYVTLNNTNYAMTISGSSATVSNVPLNSSGQDASLTVVDSRGLTYSQTVTLDIVDYTAPSVSATAERDSGFYSETNVTPTVNYTSIGANAVTINLKARKVGTTSYTVDQTIPDGQTSQVILDNEYAWEILLTVTDSLGGTGTYNITIARGLPLMYFDTEMNSVGFNQFPNNDESFEIAGDFYINSTKVDYIVEQGTSGIWTYRKWNSGVAEIWGMPSKSDLPWRAYLSTGLYYNTQAWSISYPFTLYAPSITATTRYVGGNYGWIGYASHSSNNNMTVGIIRNGNSGNVIISVYAIGKWK